ncbi:hypothetical protein SAMN05444396_103341 [Flavobacterium segetis]|uniref:Glutamyl-tRNA synthetase n=1 Tax=Flavobacterium segetis TaxID=271157 RepID=A0A1M5G868_9FLAO|nr:hypothetical protein SAMN05444396_103341 [Flavobacterium segetis]
MRAKNSFKLNHIKLVLLVVIKSKLYIVEHQQVIYQKLEAFIRKFYTNKLIRGCIFFVGLGLLYFLFTLFIEYFLWLKPAARAILFWCFIVVESLLMFRFIMFPIFKLLKFKKGINHNEASSIIGKHFGEVSDKLTNFLQLANPLEQSVKSELISASIDQRAKLLQPIPFNNAIDFKGNKKYVSVVIVPVILFALFYFSGNGNVISQSLNRVVNYNNVFVAPAPFNFVVLNSKLETEEGKDFAIKIKTIGKMVPEDVLIYVGKESYFMESSKAGEFEFKVSKPNQNIVFHLEANSVSSQDYILKVVSVPSVVNFEMLLNFPNYLSRKAEIIKGTGNAVIPEGTRVSWKISTQNTDKITWDDGNSILSFRKQENKFSLSKVIIQNADYQINTSNFNVTGFEKFNYQLSIVKDQYPTINVRNVPDSLKVGNNFVLGQIADDYGFSKLQVVYYQKGKETQARRGTIGIKNASFDQFVFSFPSNLLVEKGVAYEYYFEIFDNDAVHNYKSAKSIVFSNRVSTDEEKQDLILEQQNENIKGLEKTLKTQDKQNFEIEKLQRLGKEKESFDFKDQQKINDFINRQNKQDDMMKEFAKKVNENLEKFKTDSNDADKKELQKRLEKVEQELEKNKKLLDELKDLNNKIKEEQLLDKLGQFKQNSKNQTKSLEQLVELTKKFYVEKKSKQIADKLDNLAKKQDDLSNELMRADVKKQEIVNAEFDKIKESLDELKKENKDLKTPIDLPDDTSKEKSTEQDLNKAIEELKKDNKANAKLKQKSAAKKMKEMAQKMSESMESSEMEQLQEDVAMMRQVLDNLLAFSLSQEDLMKQFRKFKSGSPAFNKNIRTQQDLKLQFKHVDDSLFAMSLRNPKIAEDITKEIGNVIYNVDKSLSSFADAQVSRGLSHQQYTVAAANKLADFLSNILSKMQMQMSGIGKPKPGQGDGMQLPDIIKKQGALGDKIKNGIEKGKKPGDGEKGKDGTRGSNGDGGKEGESGEGDAEAIMKIYKEQRELRESLQNELEKNGLGGNGQSALEKMKQLEKEILNKGFKNETLQRILNIKQDLLKLDSALQKQGEENKRQAEGNKKEFENRSNALPPVLIDYLNSIEILNRQSLPLRSNFNQKVQEYFNKK